MYKVAGREAKQFIQPDAASRHGLIQALDCKTRPKHPQKTEKGKINNEINQAFLQDIACLYFSNDFKHSYCRRSHQGRNKY